MTEEQNVIPPLVDTSKKTNKSKEVVDLGRRNFLKLLVPTAAGLTITACQAQKNLLSTPTSAPIETPTVAQIPASTPITEVATLPPTQAVDQSETQVEVQETQKAPENIAEARNYIANLVPDEQYLASTASEIINVADEFSGEQDSSYDVIISYPSLSKDITLTVQSGNSIHGILDTSPEQGNSPEADSYKMNITVDSRLGWDDLVQEEKETLLRHELTHLLQIAHMFELADQFAETDPDNLGAGAERLGESDEAIQMVNQLLFGAYVSRISQQVPPRSYEVIPYIVDNLHFHTQPDEVKSQYQVNRTSLYYPRFNSVFGDQITAKTTVQDLVNSDEFEEFKDFITN